MTISISVGDLTDLCRSGDINFRFSGRSSATEGIRGHQRVQRLRTRQHEHYEKEVPVALTTGDRQYVVEVKGRADGVFEVDNQLVVDEIKTLRVEPSEIPEGVMNSYWLQAMIYGHILATERGAENLLLRLCLYHLDDDAETIIERAVSITDAQSAFERALDVYINLLEKMAAWRALRDTSLDSLVFPYDAYRPGQRDMAVSVFRASRGEGRLVLQAPTGIGKTMATLFPAIRTLTEGAAARVFYLSARTSTQGMAQRAVTDISGSGARIRSVTLTARDKICLSPGEPCHPDHCPYAEGYYDKIGEVIDDMLAANDAFDRASVTEAAERHEVCPFELSLDLARHCDVIISDYNYVFDPVVYLRRFFDSERRDSIVLVDEAHNLVERARDMFSALLPKQVFLALSKGSSSSPAALVKAAARVNREILALRKPVIDTYKCTEHASFTDPPDKLIKALQLFCEQAEVVLRVDTPGSQAEDLLQAYFDALRFVRTAELFDDNYRTLLSGSNRDMAVKLSCVSPASRLQEVYSRLAATVCFSATLTPRPYFEALLGFDESFTWYRLPSPFSPDNLQVTVASHLDTSWRGRQQSLSDLVDLVYDVMMSREGNYLVYFPSFDYLESAAALFEARYPDVNLRLQDRRMDEDARTAFLDYFDDSPRYGFAVMGGLFSEGIDLKGEKLIGVIVVGVGLPQLDIERDLVKDQFPEAGYEYAYLFPGFVRVLQTAGRVIRDDTDQGVICLVDRRYTERRYQSLFPPEWRVSQATGNAQVIDQLAAFWSRNSPGTGHTEGTDPAA